MASLKIGIIGAGSLGLLMSTYLAEHHDVTLYVRRKEQLNTIMQNGIERWMQSKKMKTYRVNVKNVNELEEADYLFVCVKQPEIKQVIELLAGKAYKKPAVFLQNGAGHIKLLDQLLSPVIIGVVEHGASKISDYQVNHLGKGVIKLASFNFKDDLAQVVRLLHTDEFPFIQVHSWKELIHTKLIVNAVINPITALFNVENGAIIDNPYLHHIAQILAEETANVLMLDKDEAWEYVKQIAMKTKKNTSSMRADINLHRKTEIEAITGYILQEANGRSMPYSRLMYDAILALEHERNRC